MAGKRELNAQKKREKSKKKRDQAKKSRSQRLGRNTQAASWPLSECWVSQNWHEQGATVHAMLTRTHPSGRMAAVVFEVDLAQRGVVKAQVMADAHPAEVQNELAKRSADEAGIHVTEPELVVKLVRDASRFGADNGHKQPAEISAGLAMFPDVYAEDCPHVFRTGEPGSTTAESEQASGGLWASLKKRVGLG